MCNGLAVSRSNCAVRRCRGAMSGHLWSMSLAVKVLGRLRRADEFAAWRRWEAHNVAVVVERQAAAIRAMRESDACIRALRLLGDASLRVVV